jgi:FMN phosphatase YigB (HAD superfamily)
MSIDHLKRVDLDSFDLVSSDVFDTVLLRDASLQRERFAEAVAGPARAAGASVEALARARSLLHDCGYRALAVEGRGGELRLQDIAENLARLGAIGSPEAFVAAEREADAARLTPNRPLLAFLNAAARRGKRVVATSDTWYSAADLAILLDKVVGDHPFAAIYASCDLGATKHAGDIFSLVAGKEAIDPMRILHVGDDERADVTKARSAGWTAVHLPRPASVRLARQAHRAVYAAMHSQELACG